MPETGISLAELLQERRRIRDELAAALGRYLAGGSPQDAALIGHLTRRARLLREAHYALRIEIER